MAYGAKFIFNWESLNGTEYRITVSENGYTGDALERHLGGAPVLRRDKGDHIWGTSLEFPAECRVDGEFASLYTSDPKEYLVTLDRSNAPSLVRAVVWTGYVNTEIYSEPDIAPPYDVKITATDCLGELKGTFFTGASRTIKAHLEHILAKTGLDLPIRTASALAADSVDPDDLLSSVTVDYSYLDGETDYEVLQTILSGINAEITRQGDAWIIFRQTDISSLESTDRSGNRIVSLRNITSGVSSSVQIIPFTSMSDGDWWPVGKLSSAVEPARSKGVIRTPYHVVESALENPGMDEDSGWTKGTGTTFDSDGWYSIPTGGSLYQNLILDDPDFYLSLVLKARTAIWYSGSTRMAEEYTVKVRVKGTCEDRNGNAYTMYYGNYDNPASGTGQRQYDSPFWQTAEVWNDFTVPAPSSNDEGDLGEFELRIPFTTGVRANFINWSSLEVYIYNPESDTPILVSHCSLQASGIAEGEQVTITLDNGARGEADDVELGISDTDLYSGTSPFFAGFPYIGSAVAATWSTGLLTTAGTYLNMMAQDIAMGWALPRLRKEGSINVPENSAIPFFAESGDIDFVIETFQWDLLNDELGMSMLSLPAASLTVLSIETAEYGTVSSSSPSSSSSGGSSPSSTETDPVFSASAAAGITSSDITAWNTAELPSVSASDEGSVLAVSSGAWATTSGYLKYVLCATEADYTAITTKDSGTLYLIPE